MIRLHQLGKSVQVIIDKEWTRSCKVGLEFVMTLMATGIPVYHSRNMMHYKLLTISYEDSMFALGGSANMTKAAWSRIDEFIFHVEVPAAYQAPSTLQPVAGEPSSPASGRNDFGSLKVALGNFESVQDFVCLPRLILQRVGNLTVEADFFVIGWKKNDYRKSLTDFSFEGILHAKQLDAVPTLA
ncbi:hypothetical protein PC116_g8038 [Phytophthora cactorum]|nr:hypothetical protein PC128_g7175 [Phytophthora cactorum]KAG4244084.1 hypothetical protein PC116_g8038 [Phytophthora cactorum]